MRMRRKVALSLACGAAVGLLVDFIQATRQVVIEKTSNTPSNDCEEWCPCKCHQQSCGCHER